MATLLTSLCCLHSLHVTAAHLQAAFPEASHQLVPAPNVVTKAPHPLLPVRKSPTVLRLRGGGPVAGVVVAGTAVLGGATALSMWLGTESVTNVLWLGLHHFPHDKYVAMALLGWTAGKVAALASGPEATRTYAGINSVVLAVWLITNLVEDAPAKTYILPAAFFGANVYAGFFDD